VGVREGVGMKKAWLKAILWSILLFPMMILIAVYVGGEKIKKWRWYVL
jgi:hypothetical protein